MHEFMSWGAVIVPLGVMGVFAWLLLRPKS